MYGFFYSNVTLASSLSMQELLTCADMFQLCLLHLPQAIDFIASSKSDLLCRSLNPNFLLLFFNLRPIARPHISFDPSYFMCFAIKEFLPLGFCGSLVKRSWPTLADSQYSELSFTLVVMSQVVFKTSFPSSFRYWPDQEVVYNPSCKKREERLCPSVPP